VPETPWEEQLYGAFLAEVAGGEPLFLPAFESLLASVVGTHGDVGGFHKLITLLWQFVRRNLQPGSPEWWRADALLHAARVTTSGVAERAPAREQVRFVDAAYKLTRTSNALSTVVDQASASRILAEHLPEHSILACYVCLYETEQIPVEHSRLVAGFEQGKPLALPEGGLRFATELILPNGALSREPGCHHIVGPLSRNEDSPGYVVFACGNAPGFVFENLLVHLGSLERRIALLHALVQEATLREVAERERMGKELAIAAAIQKGILPRKLAAADLEIAAVMVPASEVGGDYYDVIPVAGGAFLGIGDVAGHGLPTGLVMLMLQSAVSALARTHRDSPPSAILAAANSVLFENIHDRLQQDEYVTFTLLRYDAGGHVTYAGAHEDLFVYRARTDSVELIPTNGVWLAATRDAHGKLTDATLELGLGDVLLLYTDGLTEARNAQGEFYGPERLAKALRQVAREPVEAIRDTLLQQAMAFAAVQRDDMTLMVARRSA
jgi:phosphoserine phosphatase RsbU/P